MQLDEGLVAWNLIFFPGLRKFNGMCYGVRVLDFLLLLDYEDTLLLRGGT